MPFFVYDLLIGTLMTINISAYRESCNLRYCSLQRANGLFQMVKGKRMKIHLYSRRKKNIIGFTSFSRLLHTRHCDWNNRRQGKSSGYGQMRLWYLLPLLEFSHFQGCLQATFLVVSLSLTGGFSVCVCVCHCTCCRHVLGTRTGKWKTGGDICLGRL